MIIVYYRNNLQDAKIIRPTPFISINFSAQRNKSAYTGGQYTITLNGTLLSNAGSPVINDLTSNATNIKNTIAASAANYVDQLPAQEDYFYKPPKLIVPANNRAHSIMLKQHALRALFAHDGQRIEIAPLHNDFPVFFCFPTLDSINFEEGTYFDTCKYNIQLSTPVLYDFATGKPLKENSPLRYENNYLFPGLNANRNNFNYYPPSGYIEDFTDTWSIETDESFFSQTSDYTFNQRSMPRIYRLTRNISATGKTIYYNNQRYEAYEMAKTFIKNNVLSNDINNISKCPSFINLPNLGFGSGLLNISPMYSGFNHVRTENIDKTNGTFSLSDTWLLTSGIHNTVESYETSVSSSSDSALINVSINGKIKGLNSESANNYYRTNAYGKALAEYNRISATGSFGINADIFKRANNLTPVALNPQPATLELTHNNVAGEIDYNITFNNRPLTFFTSNNISRENITVNDTYPGDIYSAIPVLNRINGPILQYIGGRTEYTRNLNIELKVAGNSSLKTPNAAITKNSLIYRKPSYDNSIKNDLLKLIDTFSPRHEFKIRKWFINPFTENWDPKNGTYSLQISWIYEVDIP